MLFVICVACLVLILSGRLFLLEENSDEHLALVVQWAV